MEHEGALVTTGGTEERVSPHDAGSEDSQTASSAPASDSEPTGSVQPTPVSAEPQPRPGKLQPEPLPDCDPSRTMDTEADELEDPEPTPACVREFGRGLGHAAAARQSEAAAAQLRRMALPAALLTGISRSCSARLCRRWKVRTVGRGCVRK